MDQSQENMKILCVLPSTPTPVDSNPFSRFDTESERPQVPTESETNEAGVATSFSSQDFEATNIIHQDTNSQTNQNTENFDNLTKRKHENENLEENNKQPRKRKKIDNENNENSHGTTSGNNQHKCEWEECNSTFATLTDLGTHLSGHIKGQKLENRSNKKSGYICKWKNCTRNSKPFKGCYNLEHHLRYQHTGEKPFHCKSCASKFAQRSDLIEHLRNIHNQNSVDNASFNSSNCKYDHLSTSINNVTVMNDDKKVRKLLAPRTHPVPILPAPTFIYPVLPVNPHKYEHSDLNPILLGNERMENEFIPQEQVAFGLFPQFYHPFMNPAFRLPYEHELCYTVPTDTEDKNH